MKQSNLIKRTYRITKDHDVKVKKASVDISESEIIRNLIDKMPEC
jgi:short-subunit dehydrogenase